MIKKNSTKNLQKNYFINGYYIFRNVLKISDLKECKVRLIKGYKKNLNKSIDEKNIHKLLTDHEQNKDWSKMYVAFQNICKSKAFKKLTKKIQELSNKKFNVKTKSVATGYAIGITKSKRTGYDWHQEKSYYLKKDTLHYQFPFFLPLRKSNGTMSVLEGSHQMGRIKNLNYKRKNKNSVYSYVPKKINQLKKIYKEKFINLKLGDVCVFHENIIHRSNTNITKKVRFAGIVRLVVLK